VTCRRFTSASGTAVFAGRALRDHDVNQRRATVVHRLGVGALEVLRVLDKKALAAGVESYRPQPHIHESRSALQSGGSAPASVNRTGLIEGNAMLITNLET
jgi:hypothetical protein